MTGAQFAVAVAAFGIPTFIEVYRAEHRQPLFPRFRKLDEQQASDQQPELLRSIDPARMIHVSHKERI